MDTTPNRLNQNRKCPCHVLIKTVKMQNREGILKTTEVNGQIAYEGRTVRITLEFPVGSLEVRRGWTDAL